MELSNAKKFLLKQIDEFERATYTFETVVRPRFETDRLILDNLKQQYVRLDVLEGKLARGEDVSREEMESAVPVQFR